jgi:hypothetical protein
VLSNGQAENANSARYTMLLQGGWWRVCDRADGGSNMIDRDTEETVMDLKVYLDTPPWDWSGDAGKTFWRILADQRASESDRLVAAELAGDFTVINNDLVDVFNQ